MIHASNTAAEFANATIQGSEGDKRLRRIARAGKQWKKTIGRPVDVEGMYYLF